MPSMSKQINLQKLSYLVLIWLLILGNLFFLPGISIAATADLLDIAKIKKTLEVEDDTEAAFIKTFLNIIDNKTLLADDLTVKEINTIHKFVTFKPSKQGSKRLQNECSLKYQLVKVQLANCNPAELKVTTDDIETLKNAFIETNGYTRLTKDDLFAILITQNNGVKVVEFKPSMTGSDKCVGVVCLPYTIQKTSNLLNCHKVELKGLSNDQNSALIATFDNHATDKITFKPTPDDRFPGGIVAKYSVKNPSTKSLSKDNTPLYKSASFIITIVLVMIAIIGLMVVYLYKTPKAN